MWLLDRLLGFWNPPPVESKPPCSPAGSSATEKAVQRLLELVDVAAQAGTLGVCSYDWTRVLPQHNYLGVWLDGDPGPSGDRRDFVDIASTKRTPSGWGGLVSYPGPTVDLVLQLVDGKAYAVRSEGMTFRKPVPIRREVWDLLKAYAEAT